MLDEEIRSLVEKGSKIEAIKLYRERTGVGLKEAKDAVEAIVAGRSPAPLPPAADPAQPPPATAYGGPPVQPDAEVRSLVAQNRLIEAIKLYRQRSGVGLKEAKEAVDAIASGKPLPRSAVISKSGCFIATATYGSPHAAEVKALRAFRDRALAPSPAGRAFLRAYYLVSPPLARLVARSRRLRAFLRWALGPLSRAVRGFGA